MQSLRSQTADSGGTATVPRNVSLDGCPYACGHVDCANSHLAIFTASADWWLALSTYCCSLPNQS